jgi:hypothetical protein
MQFCQLTMWFARCRMMSRLSVYWVMSMQNAKLHVWSWSQGWGKCFHFITINNSCSDFRPYTRRSIQSRLDQRTSVKAENICVHRFGVIQEIFKWFIHFIGCEVFTAVFMKSSFFWEITPCSPLKDNRRFGGTCRLYVVSCLAYSSTLKMEETCSSETSVDFQQTTRRYVPEYRTL